MVAIEIEPGRFNKKHSQLIIIQNKMITPPPMFISMSTTESYGNPTKYLRCYGNSVLS